MGYLHRGNDYAPTGEVNSEPVDSRPRWTLAFEDAAERARQANADRQAALYLRCEVEILGLRCTLDRAPAKHEHRHREEDLPRHVVDW